VIDADGRSAPRELLRRVWSPAVAVPSVFAAGAAACAVVAIGFVLASSDRGLAFALVAAQTAGLAWLARLGWARGGRWASATFVTAMAWAPLLLVPSWVYAIDPGLLETTTAPAQPLALVDLSLFALIGGVLIVRASGRATLPAAPIEISDAHSQSTRALIAWGVFGLACLVALMALNGGPVAYVTHQDKSTQLNRGLFYLIWGVLFLRFAPLAAVASRWARGLSAGWPLLAYLVAGCGIVVVTGSRAFIAVAAVQALLVFALLRRMPRLRSVLPAALLVGVLLVFGLGAFKRFQAYNRLHPTHQRSFPNYVAEVAPREALGAYVNNYADNVSLIGLARRIVPTAASYEYGKGMLRLLLKPIPSPLRPRVSEAPAIRSAFDPPGGFAYAVPLQATAYIELGLPGIVLAFLLVGALLAALDRRLARRRQRNLASFLVLVTVTVQVPVLLRAGVPNGLVFLLIDAIGMWVAAVTVAGAPRRIGEQVRRVLPGRAAG
jgi:hypothetical protein